jgi:hypothetical protein
VGHLKLHNLQDLSTPTETTAVITSVLLAPTGNGGACDIYLADRANIDKFMNKADKLVGSYSYKMEASSENFKNGVVQVRGITSGVWYLIFIQISFQT